MVMKVHVTQYTSIARRICLCTFALNFLISLFRCRYALLKVKFLLKTDFFHIYRLSHATQVSGKLCFMCKHASPCAMRITQTGHESFGVFFNFSFIITRTILLWIFYLINPAENAGALNKALNVDWNLRYCDSQSVVAPV